MKTLLSLLIEFSVLSMNILYYIGHFSHKQMQVEMHKALEQRDFVQSRLDAVLKEMEAREQARAVVS